MTIAVDNALRLVELAVPALVGAMCGAAGLFPDPRAVAVLNRYALYVGFPALVARGLLLPSAKIPGEPAFWLLWPVSLALVLMLYRGRRNAAAGLSATFGNVAYLGLPYVVAVMGPEVQGPAALAVAVHVVGAVTVGPMLLARVSGAGEERSRLAARVAALPLFWAPWAGLSLRVAPDSVRDATSTILAPFAETAAAIALFLLGLHVFVERRRLWSLGRGVLGLVVVRMFVVPLVVGALGWGAMVIGWLDAELVQLHVLLAAMPLAITTFSMAHDAGVDADRVAGAVVVSSLLAVLSLPLWSVVASLR